MTPDALILARERRFDVHASDYYYGRPLARPAARPAVAALSAGVGGNFPSLLVYDSLTAIAF